MGAWHSPQSIYNLGHRAVKDLLTVPVQVQEKIDGSFFAFGMFPSSTLVGGEWVEDTDHYELKVRSKGAMMITDAPQAMFQTAVDAVKNRQHLLHPGWQYRGEVVAKRKHNSLCYDRTPQDYVILFDVLIEEETYLNYEQLVEEGKRIGFEVVPQLYAGVVKDITQIRELLATTSVLGGQQIEGVVIKPLEPIYGVDKKMLFGKFVSEAFKEVHRKSWGEANPTSTDVIGRIAEMYKNPARFNKALIHLKEAGVIEGTLRDIGKLVREIPADILKEEAETIKEDLFRYAWPHISRLIIREVPTWYKDVLLVEQFEKDDPGAGS